MCTGCVPPAVSGEIDPQVALLLAGAAARAGTVDLRELSPEQVRRIAAGNPSAAPAPEVTWIRDVRIGSPGAPIPLRVYRPRGVSPDPAPAIVYFHGGGWVTGTVDTHDHLARELAARTAMTVVSVGYRLAPENRFPAAVHDCYDAVRWLVGAAGSFGVDPARIALVGDSAGGNLAAAVTLLARERAGPPIAFQVLVYPSTDMHPDRWPSMRENGHGYLLTLPMLEWYYDQYTDPAQRSDPLASPIRAASHEGLPPALVLTAEFDPQRDEGEAYARALCSAGVPARLIRYPGMIHGFLRMTGHLDAAERALDDVASALVTALAGTPQTTAPANRNT